MNVGLMQIAEIFCPVMTKIKYMYTTTLSYVSVIIEPFWSFCVINMPKRLFIFESLDLSMMKPYRLVFITNVISEGSGGLCFCAISSGNSKVLVWMKNLDTYVLPLISCALKCACISFIKRARNKRNKITIYIVYPMELFIKQRRH